MIITAIQRGTVVYVYGKGNSLLFSLNGELRGYTSNSVSVKRGPTINVYNEHGSLISSYNA